MHRRFPAILIGVSMLTGCATAPRPKVPDSYADMKKLETQVRDTFKDLPSIVTVKLQKGALIVKEPMLSIPGDQDRAISVDFSNAEVEEILHSISSMYGINIVYQPAQVQRALQQTQTTTSTAVSPGQNPIGSSQAQNLSISSEQVRRKPVSVSFTGQLSDFLKSLSRTSGYFFYFENNAVVVREYDSFNLPVPSYGDIYKDIESTLKSLGALNTSYDRLTSTISFVADANSLQRVKSFCATLKANASFVTLRIMLLNVVFNEQHNAGIDWGKLQLGVKGQSIYNFGNQATQTSSTTSTNGSSSTSSALGPMPGFGMSGTSTGAQFFVEGSNFSLGAVVNFLESYGSTRLMQDLFVGTMNGATAHLDSGTSAAYISEISFQALSQVTTPSQAVKQASVDSGVELDFTPSYSEESGTLIMPLKISVTSATLNQAAVGAQLGSMTLPTIAHKKINAMLMMAPTQVAVIGGLVLEEDDNTGSGLPGDSVLTKTQTTSKLREMLVAVVKPVVTRFE